MAPALGALNFFAKGVHIGKILVSVEDVAVQPARPSRILRLPAAARTRSMRKLGFSVSVCVLLHFHCGSLPAMWFLGCLAFWGLFGVWWLGFRISLPKS